MPRHLISGCGVVCARRRLPSLGSMAGSQAWGYHFQSKPRRGPLGLASASEGEGGDVGQTYCVPPATLQVTKQLLMVPVYREGNRLEGL